MQLSRCGLGCANRAFARKSVRNFVIVYVPSLFLPQGKFKPRILTQRGIFKQIHQHCLVWIHRSLGFPTCPAKSHELKDLRLNWVLPRSELYQWFLSIHSKNVCWGFAVCQTPSGHWYHHSEQRRYGKGQKKFKNIFKRLNNQTVFSNWAVFILPQAWFILAFVARLICWRVPWYLWSQIKMENAQGSGRWLRFSRKKFQEFG